MLNIKYPNKFFFSIKTKLIRFFYPLILFNFSNRKKIFTAIWRNNYWLDNESHSGPGSTLSYTKNIRKKLPQLFETYKIKSLFDAPCGDFNWMNDVLRKYKCDYFGADIVKELIVNNQQEYSNKRINFHVLDITEDIFPNSDVWLCRDVFFHFSDEDIFRSLKIFCNSDIKYLLVTNNITSFEHQNNNIKTGSWRLLNLELSPFNFPKPIASLEDYIDGFPPRILALYTRAQIQETLGLY